MFSITIFHSWALKPCLLSWSLQHYVDLDMEYESKISEIVHPFETTIPVNASHTYEETT